MATATVSRPEPETTELRLSSGNGPITRTILRTPLRDASPAEIPIIDISRTFSASPADRRAVAAHVRDAATNNGFFYVTNHGVPETVTDDACAACLDFFRQDQVAKMRAHAAQSAYFNGYKPPSSQRINPAEGIDCRESFSWTYDPCVDPEVGDPAAIPEHARRFMRPEDFPWEATADLPHFKKSVLRYAVACLRLARALTRALALSLDLPEDAFDAKVRYPDAALGLNYYPPLPAAAAEAASEGSGSVSIGSHTDFQLFTILWQDGSGGLEVLDATGQWLAARPVRGALVVNMGDYLQRVTNDRYVSTVHRARNRSGRERVSMPFFWGFGLHESCAVLEGCVAEGEAPRYGEVGCEEWVQRRVREMLSVGEEGEGAKG